MRTFSFLSHSHRWAGFFTAMLLGLHMSPARATPIFERVYGFEISPTNPNAGLTRGSDGNFYGTTSKGGAFSDIFGNGYGTVFKMTTGGTVTTLVNFDLTNGSSPEAPLLQGSDGNFYGTTANGGTFQEGTVFKMTPAGDLTTLVHFNFSTGRRPMAALVQGDDGNLYGTTSEGGSGSGTVFKLTPGGSLTNLVNFNYVNGSSPQAALMLGSDGNFYGTTVRGGSSNFGTVFKVTPSGTLTTLVHFNGSNGRAPHATLVEGDTGDLYGTTAEGGSFGTEFGSGYGTVFKMTPTGALSTLVNFSNANGSFPMGALLRGGDGDFYGVTRRGGSNSDFLGNTFGTVFKMTPGGDLTTLVNFSGTDGYFPNAPGLIEDGEGNYYGTTFWGGISGQGNVFKMTSTGTLTTLVSFTVATRSYPNTLLQGSDGNLYGTTGAGGIYGSNSGGSYGTVFKMSLTGVPTTLVNFNSVNGSAPAAGLLEHSDGNFYGTTGRGGSSNNGTVFKMTPEGALTTLVHFTGGNGRIPSAGLVRGNDGNFYGTASNGGSHGRGTVFMVTPAGDLTTLVHFTGANGSNPFTALVQESDGNFYGTADSGGSHGQGTVFKMTPAGILTTLVDFSGANGSHPGALMQGSDGNFYGTTGSGGSHGRGTVFKMTPAGILTTLANFSGSNGGNPSAALVEASDGNFYGPTKEPGTIFRMTPTGTLTTLTNFTGANGSSPTAALIRGTDGNLYGTTEDGGSTSDNRPAGGGQIYRLRMGPTVTTEAQTNVTTKSATLNATADPGGYETTVSFQYSLDPTFATFSTVAAGSLPAEASVMSVQADLSDLESGSIYYFRIAASNVENTVPQLGASLSFKTEGEHVAYANWAATRFSSVQLANPLVSGRTADPDYDGVVNLLEYAFNLDPRVSGNPVLIPDSGNHGLPLIRRAGSPPTFSIQYLRRKASTNPGLTYEAQFSSDLKGSWSAFTGPETVESIDTTWERVTAEESTSLPHIRFGRVKVVSWQ